MLQDLRFRLRALFRKNVMDQELNEELRFHFENEVEKYKRAGMGEDAARRRARLAFGGQVQIREDCQDARGISFLETTIQDARYSLRTMRKNSGFFSIAALTLALGIGASVAVFSLVNTILLKPLPYPNANRVVMLWREGPLAGIGDMPWAPKYSILARAATAFQNLGAFKKESFNLTESSSPELLEGVRASAGFFPVLGVSPSLGRTFTTEEDQPGHDHVTVLSNRLWRSRFGGDAGIVGKTVDLNGYPYTVIGVMPTSFTFPNQDGIPPLLDLPKETQLWVPLALPVAPKGANEFGVIGQLRGDGRPGQVVKDMKVVERTLEERTPQLRYERGICYFSPFLDLPGSLNSKSETRLGCSSCSSWCNSSTKVLALLRAFLPAAVIL
jgi:hypothetical protein